jgi:hypothetical protein
VVDILRETFYEIQNELLSSKHGGRKKNDVLQDLIEIYVKEGDDD